MGCCCRCLGSCCCTEAGLRCHSIISLCGFVYFGFMFILFDRQKDFFEFHMPQPDNTKVALVVVAAIWLILFVLCFVLLHKKTRNSGPQKMKNKLTIADVKAMRHEDNYRELAEEEEQSSRERGMDRERE